MRWSSREKNVSTRRKKRKKDKILFSYFFLHYLLFSSFSSAVSLLPWVVAWGWWWKKSTNKRRHTLSLVSFLSVSTPFNLRHAFLTLTEKQDAHISQSFRQHRRKKEDEQGKNNCVVAWNRIRVFFSKKVVRKEWHEWELKHLHRKKHIFCFKNKKKTHGYLEWTSSLHFCFSFFSTRNRTDIFCGYKLLHRCISQLHTHKHAYLSMLKKKKKKRFVRKLEKVSPSHFSQFWK